MTMSPHQVQEILHSSSLAENEITKQIIVPCLQKISMRNFYKFRGLHFTGGRDEQGTDIEYYEMIGPDSFRHYTGIQVKKTNISVSAARELINQGNRAFEKEIIDPGITDLAVEALHISVTLTRGNSLFAFGIPPVLDGVANDVYLFGGPS